MNKFDKTNPRSIEEYAKNLIGCTFRDVVQSSGASNNLDAKHKGGLGNLLEKYYFNYDINSRSIADFEEAGLELKVSPYREITSKGERKLVAKERLVLSMINYFDIIHEEFLSSHLWSKCKLILLIYYRYDTNIDRLDYTIGYVSNFTPTQNDLAIIKNDFEIIKRYVVEGRAHELTESATMYLAAATKSSNSSVRTPQPNSNVPAKPRAFTYKQSYMTVVLNRDICNNDAESITVENNESFADALIRLSSCYIGKSITTLCADFNIDIKNHIPKNLNAMLTYRILGIKNNHCEEFEKANIQVKCISVSNDGHIKESMSFPAFRFNNLYNTTFEESELFNRVSNIKYLFSIFQYDSTGNLIFKGIRLWNMPYRDILEVERVYKRAQELLDNGLVINIIDGKFRNNLPKISESRVCHIRPHARDSRDVDVLPDGRFLPKQAFWLNAKYIENQIKPLDPQN